MQRRSFSRPASFFFAAVDCTGGQLPRRGPHRMGQVRANEINSIWPSWPEGTLKRVIMQISDAKSPAERRSHGECILLRENRSSINADPFKRKKLLCYSNFIFKRLNSFIKMCKTRPERWLNASSLVKTKWIFTFTYEAACEFLRQR